MRYFHFHLKSYALAKIAIPTQKCHQIPKISFFLVPRTDPEKFQQVDASLALSGREWSAEKAMLSRCLLGHPPSEAGGCVGRFLICSPREKHQPTPILSAERHVSCERISLVPARNTQARRLLGHAHGTATLGGRETLTGCYLARSCPPRVSRTPAISCANWRH